MKFLCLPSFWKFLAGFAAIIAVSFSLLVAVGYYETEVKGKLATPVAE